MTILKTWIILLIVTKYFMGRDFIANKIKLITSDRYLRQCGTKEGVSNAQLWLAVHSLEQAGKVCIGDHVIIVALTLVLVST